MSKRVQWLRDNRVFCDRHAGGHMAFDIEAGEVVATGVNALDVWRKLTPTQQQREAIVTGSIPPWDVIRPQTEHDALRWACEQAVRSPCRKSKRGVVIWHRDLGRIAGGFNYQPDPWACSGSEQCRANCNKLHERLREQHVFAHEDRVWRRAHVFEYRGPAHGYSTRFV